jgi:molybdate transport system substrate-binding protein
LECSFTHEASVRYRFVVTALILFLTGCRQAATPAVKIFAAISTREALQDIIEQFQADTGIAVRTNLGASSDLARQIEQGAGCDLFLSADQDWANYLEDKGLIAARKNLLANQLVIVVPADSSMTIAKLDDLGTAMIGRLALGGPAVPAGKYAREALQKSGLWEKLHGRVLDSKDVRAALAYVARKEVEAGIVYRTDALHDQKVRIALRIPPDFHSPIVYPLILIRRQPMKEDARRLYDYLSAPRCAEIFRRAGFDVIL